MGLSHGELDKRRLRAPRNLLRAYVVNQSESCASDTRSADGSIRHHALDFSTVKAAPEVDVRGRLATTASSDHNHGLFQSILTRTPWVVAERNVFFAYNFFLTPFGLLLACRRWSVFRGCGYGYLYKTRRGREFHQLQSMYVARSPQTSRILTRYLVLSGHANIPTIVIY